MEDTTNFYPTPYPPGYKESNKNEHQKELGRSNSLLLTKFFLEFLYLV